MPSCNALAILIIGALAAGAAFRTYFHASSVPRRLDEPIRLARHVRQLDHSARNCRGSECESAFGDGPRHRRRRRRRRHGRGRGEGSRRATKAVGDASQPLMSNATLLQLKPLFPLPQAYALHLSFMALHPMNRPDVRSAGVVDSWGVAKVAHGNKVGYQKGVSKRDSELLAIQRQSGWDAVDSPPVGVPFTTSASPSFTPLLTGNAWHWGRDRCPQACIQNEGVCLQDVGRCDCPRHRWGPQCQLHVQPAVSRTHIHHGWCVYNDSNALFCDKPLCEHSTSETYTASSGFQAAITASVGARPRRLHDHSSRDSSVVGTTRCLGQPLDSCPSRCQGKGVCQHGGRCDCIPGYHGPSCSRSATFHCVSDCLGRGRCELGFCICQPPYYGIDCSLQPQLKSGPMPIGHLGVAAPPTRRSILEQAAQQSAPSRRSGCTRPCVYVYELPARMNVLALKAEPTWGFYSHGPADYRAFKAVHISLLRSAHRTTDPTFADFFYVPTWDFHGSWGNPEIYWRAHQYIRNIWPFYNRSGGADHIWTNTRDAAGCSNPWGSIWDQTRTSILLSNWGAVTGLGGVPTERCFDATRDVVIPGVLHASVVMKSPFLPFHRAHPNSLDTAARAAVAEPDDAIWASRKTLIFFHGAICWQTYDKVRSLSALSRKCRQKHGFLDHYSFGVRWEVYRRFYQEKGFHLRATDLLPPPPHVSLDAEMLRSIFCLCPSGTGWGMRVFHSAALGCIPVIIQRDENKAFPPVLQAFEGLLLDWDQISVRLEASDVPRLPTILRTLAANSTALQAKRLALARMWTRLLWREALPASVADVLQEIPDAFDSLMQSLALRTQFGVDGRSRQPS